MPTSATKVWVKVDDIMVVTQNGVPKLRVKLQSGQKMTIDSTSIGLFNGMGAFKAAERIKEINKQQQTQLWASFQATTTGKIRVVLELREKDATFPDWA